MEMNPVLNRSIRLSLLVIAAVVGWNLMLLWNADSYLSSLNVWNLSLDTSYQYLPLCLINAVIAVGAGVFIWSVAKLATPVHYGWRWVTIREVAVPLIWLLLVWLLRLLESNLLGWHPSIAGDGLQLICI